MNSLNVIGYLELNSIVFKNKSSIIKYLTKIIIIALFF